MMRDHPLGTDLLAEARRVLADSVLPGLASETRYQALMAIRAIDLAEQELHANPEIERKLGQMLHRFAGPGGTLPDLTRLLSKRIRNGAFDASGELYAFLRLVVAFKLKETNPSKVRGELKNSLDRLLSESSRP